jgi:hypothetical protein
MTTTEPGDDYVASEPITVHLTPDHVEVAESAAIDVLDDDENEGTPTFELGVKIARAVLSAAAQPLETTRSSHQPDSLAGQVYALANRLRRDGQGDLADELDGYVAVHGRTAVPPMAAAAATARFDNDAVHAYRSTNGGITVWVRGPGTGDEPWTTLNPPEYEGHHPRATDTDVAESMLAALAYAGVPVVGPEDTPRARRARWRRHDVKALGHEAREVEAAAAAQFVAAGYADKQLDARIMVELLSSAGLLADSLPERRAVPDGLCGDKNDHEQHLVEYAAVANGPMVCHGDQTRRMPWAAEQAQRAGAAKEATS